MDDLLRRIELGCRFVGLAVAVGLALAMDVAVGYLAWLLGMLGHTCCDMDIPYRRVHGW
jgi:hypothetical protein